MDDWRRLVQEREIRRDAPMTPQLLAREAGQWLDDDGIVTCDIPGPQVLPGRNVSNTRAVDVPTRFGRKRRGRKVREGARLAHALLTPRDYSKPRVPRARREGDMDTMRSFNETSTATEGHASGDFPGRETLKTVREGLDAVGSYVSDTMETAQRRMVEFRDHGFDRVKDDVVKYTKEQPTNALLVAAGLGLLLGIFSGLRRR